jgi:hypothetical protein
MASAATRATWAPTPPTRAFSASPSGSFSPRATGFAAHFERSGGEGDSQGEIRGERYLIRTRNSPRDSWILVLSATPLTDCAALASGLRSCGRAPWILTAIYTPSLFYTQV